VKIFGDSKVTRKFQVTIPRAIRERLKLHSGDRLVFIGENDHILVKKGRLQVEA
jgi:AbrB family looped-hinge helix DNA binding protein